MINTVILIFVFIYTVRINLSKDVREQFESMQNLFIYIVGFLIIVIPREKVVEFAPLLFTLGLSFTWLIILNSRRGGRIKK